jgi:hypothetical protein
VRRLLRRFCPEPLILELSENDSLRLQTIIDLDGGENRAGQRRYTVLVAAIALLLMTGAIVALLLLWKD